MAMAINGTAMTYIGKADWKDQPVGMFLTGEVVMNRYRGHTWQANVMTAADFDILYALEGQQVNLTTTNYSDRNGDHITYYNVLFLKISGQHNGPVVENVRADFNILV